MQVISRCSDSPLGLEWQVRRSLRLLDQSHLAGLEFIILEDGISELTDTENAAEWVKRAHTEGTLAHVGGWYAAPEADTPAYVVLYVRAMYRAVPSFLWWSTVPTLCILRRLAHEVAHHLIAIRGYVFREGEETTDEESLANHYAACVEQRVTMRWQYKLGQRCLKEIAIWHYTFGILDWREKKYRSAAEHFYDAWNLNPENKEAGYWYWRAKEMCGG